MATEEEVYKEHLPEISAIANSLFLVSENLLKKNDNFLPHGAVLNKEGKVDLVMATPDSGEDITNSTEVLPALHRALQLWVRENDIIALGVAENVSVSREGEPPTQAVKVLFEHKDGFTIALYVPFEKKPLQGYKFGKGFINNPKPEVNAWK
jgi:hypothetical protein